MPSSSSRLALAAAAGLLPGVLGGFFLTPDATEVAALRRVEQGGDGRAGGGSSSSGSTEASGTRGQAPTPANTVGTAPRGTPAKVDTAAGGAATAAEAAAQSALRDELLALIASGRLEGKLAENPDMLLDLLVRLEVQMGRPGEALALLERQENVSMATWEQLYHLCAGANPDIGAIAMRHAFDLHLASLDASGLPTAFEHPATQHLECMLGVDPTAALEMLALLRARGMASPPEALTFEARALARNGQVDRARDVLLALMEDPEQYWAGLSTLMMFDATTAEEELRGNLQHPEWGAHAKSQLVGFLTGQGRNLEALEVFEAALAAGTADGNLWYQMIQSLDAATLDLELDRWLAMGPIGTDVQQTLANRFAAIGATKRSLETYAALWEQSIQSGGWLPQIPLEVLKAHPSDALALLDSAASKLPENDEMWGDVADMYWMAGEHDLAVAAWEHAKQLDPNDGEWTGKLDQASNGGSPVWTGDEASALGDTSDLWPQETPLSLFEQLGYGGMGYWDSSGMPFGSGVPIVGGAGISIDAGIQTLGYVEISNH